MADSYYQPHSLAHFPDIGKNAPDLAKRFEGVFEKSIEALTRLNAVGYGDGRSGLRLTLVTNPVGAYLPPAQASLEAEWKRELLRLHGVTFDALYCITNMPIVAWRHCFGCTAGAGSSCGGSIR